MVSSEQRYFLEAIREALALIIEIDPTLFFVVQFSLEMAFISVCLAACLGVPGGLLFALKTFPGKAFLQGVLNTLMALPTVVVGLVLYGLLNRQGAFGNYDLLYTPAAIIIGQSVLILPLVCNLTIVAAEGADPRLHNTCIALGASFSQYLVVYAREIQFALIAALVAGFGRAIGEVGIAMMLGGNIEGFTRTMTTAIALETSKGNFEFALALGLLLLLVAFLVNILLQHFQRSA